MFDMVNIFEVFLPQLLRYPNAADPLNGEAAALLMRDQKGYDAKVRGEHTAALPLPPPPRSRCTAERRELTLLTVARRVRAEVCELGRVERLGRRRQRQLGLGRASSFPSITPSASSHAVERS